MEYLSECCEAIPMGDTLDIEGTIPTGRCNQCHEMTVFYEEEPNDIQVLLDRLKMKGWQLSDVARELGVGRIAVYRWKAGTQYPHTSRPVILALKGLLYIGQPTTRRT